MLKNLYYFVSDVHLGLRASDASQVEKRFMGFLNSLPENTRALYLLGDIFDFWAGCCYPCFVMIFSTMTYNPAAPFVSVPFIVFSWVIAILLIITHRKNIDRLRSGTESKILVWRKKSEKENKKDEKK